MTEIPEEKKDEIASLAKVTAIVDMKTIIINKGFINSNLETEDLIEIFEPGPDIIDIETGDSLGRYDYIKSTAIVVEVYEKYSVCKKRIKESGGLSNAMSPLLTVKYSYTELNINNDEPFIISELKNPQIMVGDLVRHC